MSFTVEQLATVSRAPTDADIEQLDCAELSELDERLCCESESAAVFATTCEGAVSKLPTQDREGHGFEYETIETNDRTVTFIWNR